MLGIKKKTKEGKEASPFVYTLLARIHKVLKTEAKTIEKTRPKRSVDAERL